MYLNSKTRSKWKKLKILINFKLKICMSIPKPNKNVLNFHTVGHKIKNVCSDSGAINDSMQEDFQGIEKVSGGGRLGCPKNL